MSGRWLVYLSWRVGARPDGIWPMRMQVKWMGVHSDTIAEIWCMRHISLWEALGAFPRSSRRLKILEIEEQEQYPKLQFGLPPCAARVVPRIISRSRLAAVIQNGCVIA